MVVRIAKEGVQHQRLHSVISQPQRHTLHTLMSAILLSLSDMTSATSAPVPFSTLVGPVGMNMQGSAVPPIVYQLG
jgi:hypothetical protein